MVPILLKKDQKQFVFRNPKNLRPDWRFHQKPKNIITGLK
jgi:hypothetical protein